MGYKEVIIKKFSVLFFRNYGVEEREKMGSGFF
jgi:hypothetical protein